MKKSRLLIILSLFPLSLLANQAQEGLNELTRFSKDAYTSVSGTVTYIASAILAVGLIYVIYALATHKQNASTYLISWIIAVIFTIIFLKFI